ncbi:hypothetical protein TSAR_009056 [Trichomalopsis sarcophagae]|uniref:Alpha-carbonic anhydrase domain-containing protein n=1 Tax=Trichomalopsis sarcophagae TaxID=543379 RepID=A0A232EWI1_9HYME|nr:hypothetical protein TSAR_009056 [Trichomalopsis sarcophagae]
MSKKTKKKDETMWTSTTGLPSWKQSPVDLSPMYTLHQNFPPLVLQGHLSSKSCAKMSNTGNTGNRLPFKQMVTSLANVQYLNITLKIEFPEGREPIVRGGPLQSDEYRFGELQFRWGPSDARGAEHSVDGAWYAKIKLFSSRVILSYLITRFIERFSMEAQAVHWNTSYGSLDKCYERDDGIAVVAFLFQVIGCQDMVDNPDFACIADNLSRIKIPDRSVELPPGILIPHIQRYSCNEICKRPGCLNWMTDACSKPGYYTYNGSLSTPPFTECVTWIVIPRSVKISARQANAFRDIYNSQGERILRNFRSQQKIHERKSELSSKIQELREYEI